MPPHPSEESKRSPQTASIELEHSIGFSGIPGGLYYHPGNLHFAFASGGTVVIQSFLDPHDQSFLSGHDGPVTCMCMSKSGRYFATGQGGNNSDVIVWDFEQRRMLFRLCEHDKGVKCLVSFFLFFYCVFRLVFVRSTSSVYFPAFFPLFRLLTSPFPPPLFSLPFHLSLSLSLSLVLSLSPSPLSPFLSLPLSLFSLSPS